MFTFIFSRNRLTSSDLKHRLSSAVHIPSDLKEVIYNWDLDFDLLDIPKPIVYKISSEEKKKDVQPSSKGALDNKLSDETQSVEPNKPAVESEKALIEDDSTKASEEKEEKSNESTTEVSEQKSSDETLEPKDMQVETIEDTKEEAIKSSETSTPIAVDSESNNIVHKFNVKILMVSLPLITEIYERLFGNDFDGHSNVSSSGSKHRVSHFHKIMQLLVSKNSNGGFSLIGGKYSKQIDGEL